MPKHYTTTAKYFHWVMGVFIIGMLAFGLYIDDLPLGPDKVKLIGLHKSIGALLLIAVALRLSWRLRTGVPGLPNMPKLYAQAAHVAHYTLYALMFAMPISGWLMSSAAGFPVSVFGWFTLPNLVAPDKALGKLFFTAHTWLAYALIALLVGHVAAALWHHFIHKDDVLRRMWFSA